MTFLPPPHESPPLAIHAPPHVAQLIYIPIFFFFFTRSRSQIYIHIRGQFLFALFAFSLFFFRSKLYIPCVSIFSEPHVQVLCNLLRVSLPPNPTFFEPTFEPFSNK
ncbi:hypothetical protein M413DRAFT_188363 [Hebeloma cylindrosporum]|uniref:Uncharacterized protein n=1 Tax=Hebeloma cylindrosporum TaxID=76867 RepID=A0A0C2XQR4_HEBCY|nr:hypothetical protein M413DRAFT_188363 [Hebeloma cylindrosporum h7]